MTIWSLLYVIFVASDSDVWLNSSPFLFVEWVLVKVNTQDLSAFCFELYFLIQPCYNDNFSTYDEVNASYEYRNKEIFKLKLNFLSALQ